MSNKITRKNSAVLISIRPKWCQLIATGKKTVEVRKTRPRLETPFKVYIYCTKGCFGDLIRVRSKENAKLFGYDSVVGINPGFAKEDDIQMCGGVIGEFICDRIIPSRGVYGDELDHATQLSYEDLQNYGQGKQLYGWHISDLVIYEKPRLLSEFSRPELRPLSDFASKMDDSLCHYCFETNFSTPLNHNHGDCEGRWCEDAYAAYIEENEYYIKRAPQSWCYVKEEK